MRPFYSKVTVLQPRTKFMQQFQEITQNWTGPENFDVCFFRNF